MPAHLTGTSDFHTCLTDARGAGKLKGVARTCENAC